KGLAWREAVEASGLRGPEDLKALGITGPFELHPREYYMYELRGVVVHLGTANQGHYFSYIRDRELEDLGKVNLDESILEPCLWGSEAGARRRGEDNSSEDRSGPERIPGTVSSVMTGTGEVYGLDLDSNLGKQKWCEFNDTIVKEWKVLGPATGGGDDGTGRVGGGTGHGLEASCFGGQQLMQ
ncbi:unnamed protein product, partial [Choristocarpus tenellus]